jgi:hypothetical protein
MKSSTKLSLVAAAVAAAIGTSAQALPPAAWTNGTITSANLYYAGGGSAEVQAVYVAVSKLLVTTSIDVYTDGSGSAKHPQSANYLIVSGTTRSGGTPVGFFYKYNGGSFTNGVQPFLGAGSKLAYPTTTSLATASSLGTSSPTSVSPDYTFSSALDGGDTPAWGISDEEASLFGYAWNANGANPGAIINGTPLYVAPFGIAVTANVYAQKKNWSSAEVAAVYQGATNNGISAWSLLTGDNGSPLTIPGGINLLDRGSGSGSKAAANAFFLDYPAGSFKEGGDVQPASVTSTTVNNYTNTVGLVTSGAATNGFQDIKEASSVAIVDDLNNAQVAGLGAIAALGLEFPPVFEQTTTGTNSYFFVSINGSYPDAETGTDNINSSSGGSTQYSNVVNGRYTFAYQTGFNTKTSPTGFQASVAANLAAESISAANTGTGFPAATDGVLLDSTTTGTTDAGNVNWTRGANSTSAPIYVQPVTAAKPDPL